MAEPPPAAIGRTAVVTDHDRGASVWLLSGPDISDVLGEPAGIAPTTQTAWTHAAIAASRSVSVLWTSVRHVEGAGFRIVKLGGLGRVGEAEPDLNVVEGPSFGVSFLLSIVSTLFGIPMPVDVVASAAISSSGSVSPVGRIAEKIAAVLHVAPQVRRLIVAGEQLGEATQAAAGRLLVIPVSTGEEAVRVVFDNAPQRILENIARDPKRAPAMSSELFKLATRGRGEVHEWRPVANAASVVLAIGAGLDEFDRYNVELAGAIAARHSDNSGVVKMPSESWLKTQPRPARVGLMATLVQQAADTGIFDAREVETLARGQIGKIRDAEPAELKLAGALARLLAVTGRPQEALAIQAECAAAFLLTPEPKNVSQPLSEWYRLSGVVEDNDAFDRAEVCLTTAVREATLDPIGRSYVDFARARGAVLLRRATAVGAIPVLGRLASDPNVHDGVKWSAARWQAWGLRDSRDLDQANAVMQRLLTDARESTIPAAQRAAILAQLDLEIFEGRGMGARSFLQALSEMQPGIVGHLISAAAPGTDTAAFVAKTFPY